MVLRRILVSVKNQVLSSCIQRTIEPTQEPYRIFDWFLMFDVPDVPLKVLKISTLVLYTILKN